MTPSKQSGFTLLELMITVAVLGILTALAYPNMRNFLRRNQAIAQSNSIRANLQFARGQAAATRSYVSICPLATAGSQACGTSGSYDLGWIIYTTATPNSAYNGALATNVIQLVVAAPINASIRASSVGPLTYNARGELLVNATASTNVTFTTCAKSSASDLIGTNTTVVPGVQISAASSGRVASNTLTAGAACT